MALSHSSLTGAFLVSLTGLFPHPNPYLAIQVPHPHESFSDPSQSAVFFLFPFFFFLWPSSYYSTLQLPAYLHNPQEDCKLLEGDHFSTALPLPYSIKHAPYVPIPLFSPHELKVWQSTLPCSSTYLPNMALPTNLSFLQIISYL